MKDKNRKLTELDIKYISKLIGRDPNEYELDLIEHVNNYELTNRNYLGIVARLNHGANRSENENILIEQEKLLKFQSDIEIFDDKKLTFQGYQSENEYNNVRSFITNHTVISKNFDLKPILNKYDGLISSISVQSNSSYNDSIHIVNNFTIEIETNLEKSNFINYQDNYVYKIEIGNNTKKNREFLANIIEMGVDATWIKCINVMSSNGLAYNLLGLLQTLDSGIIFDKEISFKSLLEKNKKLSLMVVIQKNNKNKFKSYCKKNDLTANIVGKLITDRNIQLNDNIDSIINLPLAVFELQYDINAKHFEEPESHVYKSSDQIKGVSKTSLSNQLIKLFKKIIDKNYNIYNGNKDFKNYGITTETNHLKDQLMVVSADANNLLHIAPRMSGKVSIANAARKMACIGVKPNFVAIHNLLPEPNQKYIWHASELLQGQEEAIRELELNIAQRKIDTFKNSWQQNILVIGQKNQNKTADIAFKSDGDFISLLGSHRGELGASEYQKYISDKSVNVSPSVDLNMERRLQDVVKQGINTNLLNSATNISFGGISMAIAMSLAVSNDSLGAKIHLSRKLSDEEILFGETQGLVVVTLAEEDIMEFERICMTVGVPSTTIGRVTDNNTYTFNESIKIKVEKLRELLT